MSSAIMEKDTVADVRTHNGVITVKSASTGDHRTFKITTQRDDADFAPGERVIGLLSGPDNTADYKPFGFATDRGVFVWKKYRDTVFAKYAHLLNNLASALRCRRVKVNYEGKCRVCNRPLTTPESVASGIGPVCAEKGGF